MLYSKRRKNLGGGRRKRSNRRSYGLKRYNKYGGDLKTPIVYTQETIQQQIEKYKNNKSCFGSYRPNGSEGEYGLDNIKTKNHNFYENNLCVFVDFSLELAWHTTRMYLGEMTSSAEELANFRKDRKQLSFKCYLLYSDDRCPEEELFTKNFTFDSLPHKGVLIGFLPNEFKDIVLNEAEKLRQK